MNEWRRAEPGRAARNDRLSGQSPHTGLANGRAGGEIRFVDADVLIAGCGPVGAVLAALLGGRGVRVAVVDPAADAGSPSHPHPRAAVLDAHTQRILRRIDGLAGWEDWAVPLRRSQLLAPDRRPLLTLRLPDGVPAGVMLDQPRLERALRDRLARTQTVRLYAGRSVTALQQSADRVTVTLDDGSSLTAAWLVGCDGASSTVRGLIGVGYDGVSYPEPWLVVDARTDEPGTGEPTFSYVLDPARPMVAFERPGARRWEWMLLPGEDPAGMTARADELIRPWADPAALRVERAAVFTFHARTASAWRRGRVLLAGDAAHSMPPFTGQGLGAGLRDVATLSWLLTDAPADLDRYERERRPAVTRMTRTALRTGRIVLGRNHLAAAALRGVVRTAGLLPGLDARVATAAAAPERLPDGTRQLPDTPLVVDGRRTTLDALLGNRWGVLSGGAGILDPETRAWLTARDAVFADMDGFAQGQVTIVRPDRFIATGVPLG
ncbi:3-(3-hydroxyphenyl)propionate hydroxylase [Micromonospora musae]|uniref:3-(3-hydroxyphenyl)propionate hydroxylase n=1 Tax=Micromonospora musae TaxID=1894970 RepID=A0ABX9RJR0_9ACTN|nr:3-(3-hydroxyphenyl)propionate hydroxylase [Micromonospora musae]